MRLEGTYYCWGTVGEVSFGAVSLRKSQERLDFVEGEGRIEDEGKARSESGLYIIRIEYDNKYFITGRVLTRDVPLFATTPFSLLLPFHPHHRPHYFYRPV